MNRIVKVVVRLNGRSAMAKLDHSRYVVTKMTGNANFTALAAQVTALGAAADALEDALTEARSGSHEAVAAKDLAAKAVMDQLAMLCSAINGIAAGDVAKLITTGLPLRLPNSPIGELFPPMGLLAQLTRTKQRVALEWEGQRGARSFNVYTSPVPAPFDWKLIGSTTKSKFNVEGLTSGAFAWYAVSAVGSAGESSLSAPCYAMAS
jgi:hypothetical protein